MTSGHPSNPAKKIQLVRIAHVFYKHEKIDDAKAFMHDFGFQETETIGKTTYFRGYGTEPFVLAIEASDKTEFGGAAFAVESEEDLVFASKSLPASAKPSDVYDLKTPGGGKGVTFYDPVDGFPFHLVHGQTPVEPRDPHFPILKVNYPTEKNRGPNQFQRFQKRPAPVHKLGHFGMCVTDFAACYDFYTTHFNFFPSELVHDAAGVDKTVFFRLNRGAEFVDHHCFFFFEGPKMHVHHSSFETHDFDTQVLGHDWLREKGFDPSGFILEHYVDGDLLDMNEPTHHTKAGPGNLHVWGPEVPETFLQ